MLNRDDNENGFKKIDLISKKTNCTCSTLSPLISKKQICTCSTLFLLISRKQICMCSTLFYLSLAVFLRDYNAVL